MKKIYIISAILVLIILAILIASPSLRVSIRSHLGLLGQDDLMPVMIYNTDKGETHFSSRVFDFSFITPKNFFKEVNGISDIYMAQLGDEYAKSDRAIFFAAGSWSQILKAMSKEQYFENFSSLSDFSTNFSEKMKNGALEKGVVSAVYVPFTLTSGLQASRIDITFDTNLLCKGVVNCKISDSQRFYFIGSEMKFQMFMINYNKSTEINEFLKSVDSIVQSFNTYKN